MSDQKAEKQNLSTKQEKALLALLSEPTIATAAKKVGITERTLYRWLAEPCFKEVYHDACRSLVQQTMSQLQIASTSALSVTLSIMNNANEKSNIRLIAAKTVLDGAMKVLEIRGLEEKITFLEMAVEQMKK